MSSLAASQAASSRRSQKTDDSLWIPGRTREEAEKKASERFPGEAFQLEQDEDVLDTWFSSGLWPFSIMGWPEKVRRFALSV